MKLSSPSTPILDLTAVTWGLQPERSLLLGACNDLHYPSFLHAGDRDLGARLNYIRDKYFDECGRSVKGGWCAGMWGAMRVEGLVKEEMRMEGAVILHAFPCS